LGELEAAVVHRLWERDRPADIQELLEDLQHNGHATRAALRKALDVLHRTGLLERESVDGADVYRPAISHAELRDLLMSQVLGTARSRVGSALTCVKRITPAGSVP
jgi:predicted transcriptional regulator